MKVPAHGGQLRRIAERFGVDAGDLLDFSANINPEGPPPGVVTALREAAGDARVLREYPDLEESELRGAIAAYAGAPMERVTVANGFVPLLDAALQSLAVRRCLLPVPCFAEYRAALERAGVEIATVALDAGSDFRYQAEELLAGVGCDAILLANPQNPSGVLWERDGVLAFVEEAGRRGVRVLLDEAFLDYAPGNSLVGEVGRLGNLTVFRSVTKFHGMPGLRVAYAVGNGELPIAPWAITTLAALGVRAALADKEYAERTLRLNVGRREELADGLRGLGVYAYPAAANFLLFRVAGVERVWERMISEEGIVLRNCSNFEGLSEGHLRCAVLGEGENRRLVAGLGRVLGVAE